MVCSPSSTYIVQVNVDATKVVQHKVSNRVGTLDGIGVAVERLEEPRVLVGDELAGRLVGPELVSLAPSPTTAPVVVVPCIRSPGADRCSSAGDPSSALECSR